MKFSITIFYSECHYAECHKLFIVMLNMLSVIMLNVMAPYGGLYYKTFYNANVAVL
jgi:hypothetical protein